MSSTTIRHSGVLENTQSAAHLATGHHANPRRPVPNALASHYPPGFGPGEPHYEPAHLRHKPGDDWQIGGRPHDPADPGHYGTPGWYQDRRTGRHRRGELPDPLPETALGEAGEPYRFSRLREDAYQAFLRDSEELHQAHYETAEPSRALIHLRWLLRVLLAVLHWRILPFSERPAEHPTEPPAVHRAAPSPVPRVVERRRFDASGPTLGGSSAPQVFFDAVRVARLECRTVGGEAR